MNNLGKLAVVMASFAALAACARTSPPDTAADQAAIRAVGTSWYKAYNGGDGAAVAALYAEDAVLSAPHVPAARGAASIREYFLKDAATFTAAGIVQRVFRSFGSGGSVRSSGRYLLSNWI